MLGPLAWRPVLGVGVVREITREDLFLVTKAGFSSYEHAEKTVEQPLASLQSRYVDLLLLHWSFANYYAARHAPETPELVELSLTW